MPIIEATFVTKTDMSVAWERKKIAAPVTATLAKPSASGSAAAASEPNTARTIGKPVVSAAARSSLARSCMPAQRACWPTRWGSTPSPLAPPPSRSSRMWTARSAVSSSVPEVRSGRTTIEPSAAWCLARATAPAETETCGRRAASRAARSSSARTPAVVAPGLRATITARLWLWAPSKRCRLRSTTSEPDPGTSKPPAVRWSVCLEANGAAATSRITQAPTTHQRRRSRNLLNLSIARCISQSSIWLASQNGSRGRWPLCEVRHTCEVVGGRWWVVGVLRPTAGGAGVLRLFPEQAARRPHPEIERRPALPARVRAELDAEAVAQGEEDRGDGVRIGLEVNDSLALLLAQRLGEVAAPAAVDLGKLGPDLLAVTGCAQHLVGHRLAARLLLDELLEPVDEGLDNRIDGVGAREPLLHRLDLHLAVVTDDLDEQPLLRAEVVVEEPPRDAGLAGDVVEGRGGGAPCGDARAHSRDDPLRLVSLELAGGFDRCLHRAPESSWPANHQPVAARRRGAVAPLQSWRSVSPARRCRPVRSKPLAAWSWPCTRTPPRRRRARRGPSCGAPRSGRGRGPRQRARRGASGRYAASSSSHAGSRPPRGAKMRPRGVPSASSCPRSATGQDPFRWTCGSMPSWRTRTPSSGCRAGRRPRSAAGRTGSCEPPAPRPPRRLRPSRPCS